MCAVHYVDATKTVEQKIKFKINVLFKFKEDKTILYDKLIVLIGGDEADRDMRLRKVKSLQLFLFQL